MSRFSGIGDFLKRMKGGNLGGIVEDIRNFENVTPASFSPDNIGNWFNTRIFGKRVNFPATYARTEFPSRYNSAFYGLDSEWTANTGALNTLKNITTGKPAMYGALGSLGAYGTYKIASGADRVAGFMHGGPDYGGYIGFGEGHHSERSALQGARTNMNYQAQMMGLQALSSNQIAPQYSLSIAPMRQRRSSAALRNSTQGLARGLHSGRHGGY